MPQGDTNGNSDDYEIIAKIEDADSDVVDMNRKVMRSLSKGERILEAVSYTHLTLPTKRIV